MTFTFPKLPTLSHWKTTVISWGVGGSTWDSLSDSGGINSASSTSTTRFHTAVMTSTRS